jgi:predicted AlkP superfamily phosphohydrolase/phosphomutase
LRQGVFDLPEFLTQSRLVFQDELDLLHYSLHHFHSGLLFFYFSAIDQNSHMLWGKHDGELLPIYQRIDAAIGEVMNTMRDADLIVMSDHGFTRFDRAVNLNTWLWKQGYLALKGPPGGDDELFANVDWQKTQLYALGLNGLYLNLAGREKYGIVKRGPESQAILSNVTAQLRSLRDSIDGRQVVETVYAMPVDSGPDMIVGYARGYRASWQTALGGVPENILDDNTDAWIADHCINAEDVPGVLFSNRKLLHDKAELKDLTVSILGLFGVSPGAGMTGKVVF